MRISKKFVGSNYNGKQIYSRRTGADRLSNEAVKERRAKLCGLEQKFLAKIAPGSTRRVSGSNNNASVSPNSMPIPASMQPPASLQDNASAARQLASVLSLQNMTQEGGGNGASIRNSGIDLRNLLNQAAANNNGNNYGNNNTDVPRTLSMLSASLNGGGNDPTSSTSSQSLQNLFQELVKSTSNHDSLSNFTHTVGANSTDSLQAFQAMFQQQQAQQANHAGGGAPKSNSRAAAAGRALLGSLGGGGGNQHGHHTSAPAAAHQKDISSFTSAELAAELRKRSSLQDLMATLTGGSDSKRTTNVSAASFQDTLQQAAEANNVDAFSSLLRNSAVDMSNLVERQGSIDSLSNLAIRSRLQSMQSSMGSLLDPLLDSVSSSAAKNNSTWNPASNASSRASADNAMNLPDLKSLVAKVSQGSIEPRSANDLMESLGMNRTSLSNLANASAGNSGLNLASLLHNEDALRRLETSASSSLHQNFAFQQNQDNHSEGSSSGMTEPAAGATSGASNTAIAQFLLQKQLLGQAGVNKKNDQQRHTTNDNAATGGGNSGGIDSALMSTLLSQLRSAERDGQQQDDGGMEAPKRKFFSQEALAGYQQDEQRRNKPFR